MRFGEETAEEMFRALAAEEAAKKFVKKTKTKANFATQSALVEAGKQLGEVQRSANQFRKSGKGESLSQTKQKTPRTKEAAGLAYDMARFGFATNGDPKYNDFDRQNFLKAFDSHLDKSGKINPGKWAQMKDTLKERTGKGVIGTGAGLAQNPEINDAPETIAADMLRQTASLPVKMGGSAVSSGVAEAFGENHPVTVGAEMAGQIAVQMIPGLGELASAVQWSDETAKEGATGGLRNLGLNLVPVAASVVLRNLGKLYKTGKETLEEYRKLDPTKSKEIDQALKDPDLETKFQETRARIDQIRTNLAKGAEEPPAVTRDVEALQEADLRARLEEPPVKGIPDEPAALEQATTPEVPQNAVETPIKASEQAKQEFASLWDDIKADLGDFSGAAHSGIPLTPGQLRAVSKLPGLAAKGAKVVYHSASEFVEDAVKNLGEWAREHAQKAWDEAHPQGKDFGLATSYEPSGRPTSGFVDPDDLARVGEELVTSGKVVPANVYKAALYNGHVTPDEIAAVAYRGKQVENRIETIEAELGSGTLDDADLGARMAELKSLQSEMDSVLEVGEVAQKTFHQTGQALQVAFSPTYTPVRVKAMAKAYNFGEELDPTTAKKLDTLTKGYAEARAKIGQLEADLAKAMASRQASGTRSPDVAVRKPALVQSILSDLGLDKHSFTDPVGGSMGKKAGAVSVPKGKEKQMAAKVNSLTKIYIEDGAQNLDEIVKRFQADMPLLSRDDVLGLLNKEYRTASLEADVHKLEIERALRLVQDQAKRARTPVGKRLVQESGDAVVSLQRQMQAGLDTSLSFIQGLPGLIVSPSNWGKAWVPWFKTVLAKDAQLAVSRGNAKLHADPAFKFARKAGLGFSDLSGPYAMQEEVMLGHLAQRARESKIPLMKHYFELLSRSQEGGSAFLNQLRLDLFKKFTAGNYKDEQTLKDAAMLVNILTGRGSGAMADALSAKPFGYIAYAPRYTWSKYQNAALPLLLPTKITSKAGRKAAASAWTKQSIAVLSVPFIAKSLGLEVETDMRSTDFGAVTLPNGGKMRLFKHFTEPVQKLYQMGAGRVSRKGNLTEPGYQSGQMLGDYATGKLSPVAGAGWRQLTNNRYDSELGKGVGFNLNNPEDQLRTAYELFTPLSVQNAVESLKAGDAIGAFLSMMGIEYSPAKGNETSASSRR